MDRYKLYWSLKGNSVVIAAMVHIVQLPKQSKWKEPITENATQPRGKFSEHWLIHTPHLLFVLGAVSARFSSLFLMAVGIQLIGALPPPSVLECESFFLNLYLKEHYATFGFFFAVSGFSPDLGSHYSLHSSPCSFGIQHCRKTHWQRPPTPTTCARYRVRLFSKEPKRLKDVWGAYSICSWRVDNVFDIEVVYSCVTINKNPSFLFSWRGDVLS